MAKKTFEQALTRLEQLVSELEQGKAELDAGLKLFEEGVQLTEFCRRKLTEAQGQVELLAGSAGGLAAVPFPGEGDACRSQP